MRRLRKRKLNWKKCLLKSAVVVVAGFFLLAATAGVIARSLISKEYLIGEIEDSINSEVEIGDVDISIFRLPARVILSDVGLAPRSGAKSGAKSGARSGAEAAGPAPVRIEQVSLSVGLWGLFGGHIDVRDITIRGAALSTTYREDGSTTLGSLFAAPDGKDRVKPAGGRRGGFNVHEQEGLVATLGGLSIVDSRADITLESTGLRLRCTDVSMHLSAIRIDPAKLEQTNTAKLEVRGKIRMDSPDGRHYGDLDINGQSNMRIFNPRTGNAEPEVEGDFNLGEESWLSTRVPFVTRTWNHLSILEKVGIKVATLPDRATFGRSEAIALHYHLGRITVSKPLSLWVGDWELAAMEDSWLQVETDQHEIHAELLASKRASAYFDATVMRALDMLSGKTKSLAAADIEKQLFRDGRLLVEIKSSGDFSDPVVRPVGAVVDLGDAAKQAAKKLLKEKAGGFLNGLLGGDAEQD